MSHTLYPQLPKKFSQIRMPPMGNYVVVDDIKEASANSDKAGESGWYAIKFIDFNRVVDTPAALPEATPTPKLYFRWVSPQALATVASLSVVAAISSMVANEYVLSAGM